MANAPPLGLILTGANRHDSVVLAPVLDAVPGLRFGGRGRPRKRRAKLHADKAYDSRRCRMASHARNVASRIVRKGIESYAHPGCHRWVVERTFAWFRRLATRYERRANIHHAFTTLAAALFCIKQIRRFC